jgi:hypothetical protein
MYTKNLIDQDILCKEPNLLLRDDNFLSADELKFYNNLLPGNWTMGPSTSNIFYFSKDLYNHYKWDGNFESAGWLDSTPPEWEILYNKISAVLPKHYTHWIDLKITPPLCGGTPLHRDKDPWTPGGGPQFSRALSVLCNLNEEPWDPDWGGGFITHTASRDGSMKQHSVIPIVPGQLVVLENCYHSIEPITKFNKYRKSFILHVLEYK